MKHTHYDLIIKQEFNPSDINKDGVVRHTGIYKRDCGYGKKGKAFETWLPPDGFRLVKDMRRKPIIKNVPCMYNFNIFNISVFKTHYIDHCRRLKINPSDYIKNEFNHFKIKLIISDSDFSKSVNAEFTAYCIYKYSTNNVKQEVKPVNNKIESWEENKGCERCGNILMALNEFNGKYLCGHCMPQQF